MNVFIITFSRGNGEETAELHCTDEEPSGADAAAIMAAARSLDSPGGPPWVVLKVEKKS